MGDPSDFVWKALADPTRRRVLDLLKEGPRTTGDLCEQFDMSRFGVMKHLGILEAAELVTVRRKGRERWNYLNAVPIRRIYERWVSQYAEFWSASLISLKDTVEDPNGGEKDE
jgi:DNA-binding transcriptional ArsR family regulator